AVGPACTSRASPAPASRAISTTMRMASRLAGPSPPASRARSRSLSRTSASPAGPLSDDVVFVPVPSLVEAVDGQGAHVHRRWPAEEQVPHDLADGRALEEAV